MNAAFLNHYRLFLLLSTQKEMKNIILSVYPRFRSACKHIVYVRVAYFIQTKRRLWHAVYNRKKKETDNNNRGGDIRRDGLRAPAVDANIMQIKNDWRQDVIRWIFIDILSVIFYFLSPPPIF